MKNRVRNLLFISVSLVLSFFNNLFIEKVHGENSISYPEGVLSGDIVPTGPAIDNPSMFPRNLLIAILIPLVIAIIVLLFIKNRGIKKKIKKGKKES